MESQLRKAFELVSQPDNQAIQQGEHILLTLKPNANYPLALLQHLNNPNTHQVPQLRAAIELKLWCSHFRQLEQFERQFYNQQLEDLKKGILLAYLTFPLKISKTLRPGLVSLTQVLFPHSWQDLLSTLLSYACQTPGAMVAVLKLIQAITHKYTYQSRSDPLFEEIILVCDQVHGFLLELTLNTLQGMLQNPGNVEEAIRLEVLLKVFYNLNYQDLHPKFEDNLSNWMGVLKQVMGLPNSTDNMFKCKGAALEAILLYSSKYKEDVQGLIQEFCQEIWQLCSGASEDPEYDDIVFNCLKFFKSLMMWPDMKPFFETHILQLFQNLILPNIGVTKTMVGLFQDEIDLFIDFYFRNTEINTRRAAALELLRVICRHYSHLFEPFLQKQIQTFQSIAGDMNSELNLISLVIDGSAKGFRDVDGCTQLFVNESCIQFTYQQIVKKKLFSLMDWLGKNEGKLIETEHNLVYLATIIRFLFYFRIYFPRDEVASLVQFLTSVRTGSKSLSKVVQLTINGFLILKHGDFNMYRNMEAYFKGDRLKSIAVDVLKVAYAGTTQEPVLQESLTKMMYNLTKGLGVLNGQFFQYQIEIVKEMLKRTTEYDFTTVQYLFETLGVMAYWLVTSGSGERGVLEKVVMDFFMEALKNKSDLMNFCLQVLAIYLQLENSTNQQYVKIYESLLMPENWQEENQSLMSAYIQFLIAFIAKHRHKLIEDKGAVEVILSKIIEIEHVELFYRFMEAIMINTSLREFYESGYLNLVVQGGQVVSKTVPGRKASLIFICKLVLYYDTIECLNLINQCCEFYFDQLLEANLDIVQTITQRNDRKHLFASICRAANLNYFQNLQLLGTIVNSLITNTSERFNIRNMSLNVSEAEQKEKKESTYKKLMVFREFEKQPGQLQINEEQEILGTFKNLNDRYPQIINLIDQKNRDRLGKINDNAK